jgi:hypothetical protein
MSWRNLLPRRWRRKPMLLPILHFRYLNPESKKELVANFVLPDKQLRHVVREAQLLNMAREFIAAIFEEEKRYDNEPRGY